MSVYAGHAWNLERMRVSVGLSLLFITLQLESCSKFLAVFAAFADSPCAAEKTRFLSQCAIYGTNVAGKRSLEPPNNE